MESSRARAWHGAQQAWLFGFGGAFVPGNIPLTFVYEALRSVGVHRWLPLCYRHLGLASRSPSLACGAGRTGGAAAEAGQENVWDVFSSPIPYFPLYLNPPSLSSSCSQILHPFPFPPSLAAQSHLSTLHLLASSTVA